MDPVLKAFLSQVGYGWHRRRDRAADMDAWDGAAVGLELRQQVARAEELGLLDASFLDGVEARMVAALEDAIERLAPVRDRVGSAIAESVFGACDYRESLGRQLATACGATADVAVDEAVSLAVFHASLLVAEANVTLRPAWPTSGTVRLDDASMSSSEDMA